MFNAMSIFDRDLVRCRRDRAAEGFTAHDFLFREIGRRLVDRLQDVQRCFPLALELGCRTGALTESVGKRQGGGITYLVRSDLSEGMARWIGMQAVGGDQPVILTVVADEERLPFQTGRFDLIFSNLSLHWVNDLPGTLIQIWQALKPDSFFLASMIGGSSLSELRAAFADAENGEEGRCSPRVSPFADVRDVGNLLQRTGFVLPVVDCDTITINYPNPLRLLQDLRGMGESNAMRERRRAPLRRGTLKAALDRYHTRYADVDGRVPATIQILYLAAWTPSQP